MSGMHPRTPIPPVTGEEDLIPAQTLLNHYQRMCAYRLFPFPDPHPVEIRHSVVNRPTRPSLRVSLS